MFPPITVCPLYAAAGINDSVRLSGEISRIPSRPFFRIRSWAKKKHLYGCRFQESFYIYVVQWPGQTLRRSQSRPYLILSREMASLPSFFVTTGLELFHFLWPGLQNIDPCPMAIDIVLFVCMFVKNQWNIFLFTADESNTTEFLWNCSFRREGKDEGKVCNRIQVKKRTVFSSDKNIDPDP